MEAKFTMFGIKERELDDAINNSLLRADMGNIFDVAKKSQLLKRPIDPTFAELEKERILRNQLNSSDGVAVDLHDQVSDFIINQRPTTSTELLFQFYRDHKLLLILFRVLAVMPIERSAPGKMTFSWTSTATIYAILFYIVTSGIVLVVGWERVKIFQTTTQFDDYIYAFIFVIFLVPHFWIPFVGWGVAEHVAVYKTMWGTFQLRYYRVTGESLQFPRLKLLIVILSVGCLLLAIGFLLALCALMEGFYLWHTSAYYHIVTMINMNSALWYINCRAFRVASKSLSDCFAKDVRVQCSASVISQYRFLWLNLSELLQTLGNAYTRTYSAYCLFMFVNITIAIYGALSEILDHGFAFSFKEIGLFVDAIYCTTLLYIFAECSDNATRQVAQGVQDTLLSLNLLQIDQQTQKEIDLFIQAIEMNPAIVSLKGYANVNRELLTSVSISNYGGKGFNGQWITLNCISFASPSPQLRST